MTRLSRLALLATVLAVLAAEVAAKNNVWAV